MAGLHRFPNGDARNEPRMTDDNAQQIAELEAELNRLCAARAQTVAYAESLIAEANKEFDRKALSLNRKLAALRVTSVTAETKSAPQKTRQTAETKPAPQRTRQKREKKISLEGTEGWSPEEIAMYRSMAS